MAARGWPERVSASLRAAADGLEAMKNHHFEDAEAQERLPFPAPGRRNAVIVGDSHGADLLTRAAARQLAGQLPAHPHPLVLPADPRRTALRNGTRSRAAKLAEECFQQADVLKDNPLLRAADLILVASSWTELRVRRPAQDHRLPEVALPRSRWCSSEALRVHPTECASHPGVDLRRSQSALQRCQGPGSDEARNRGAILHRRARTGGLRRPPRLHLRRDCGRLVCPLFLDDGELLYWDSNHWTESRRAACRASDSALPATTPYLF